MHCQLISSSCKSCESLVSHHHFGYGKFAMLLHNPHQVQDGCAESIGAGSLSTPAEKLPPSPLTSPRLASRILPRINHWIYVSMNIIPSSPARARTHSPCRCTVLLRPKLEILSPPLSTNIQDPCTGTGGQGTLHHYNQLQSDN
jgi:hypothetical protein